MEFDATINLLREQNVLLERITDYFDEAAENDLDRAEKERESNKVLSELKDAILGLVGKPEPIPAGSVSESKLAARTATKPGFLSDFGDTVAEVLKTIPGVAITLGYMGKTFGTMNKVFAPVMPFLKGGARLVSRVATRFLMPLAGILNGLEGFFKGYEREGFMGALRVAGIGILDGIVGWVTEAGANMLAYLNDQIGGPESISQLLRGFDFHSALKGLVDSGTEFFTDLFAGMILKLEAFDISDFSLFPVGWDKKVGEAVSNVGSAIRDGFVDGLTGVLSYLPKQFQIIDKVKDILGKGPEPPPLIDPERAMRRSFYDGLRQQDEEKNRLNELRMKDLMTPTIIQAPAPAPSGGPMSYSTYFTVQGDSGNKAVADLKKSFVRTF